MSAYIKNSCTICPILQPSELYKISNKGTFNFASGTYAYILTRDFVTATIFFCLCIYIINVLLASNSYVSYNSFPLER